MPLKRAVTEFGKTYKDRFALRTYPGTSVPIFIFILGWSRTKPRVTLSAQTMIGKHAGTLSTAVIARAYGKGRQTQTAVRGRASGAHKQGKVS